MVEFSWEEYKEFRQHTNQTDKLKIAIDFIRSYYNMNCPGDMYTMLATDDIGLMMLKKRGIKNAEGLESFMYQSLHG